MREPSTPVHFLSFADQLASQYGMCRHAPLPPPPPPPAPRRIGTALQLRSPTGSAGVGFRFLTLRHFLCYDPTFLPGPPPPPPPPHSTAYDFTRYPSFADLGVTAEGVSLTIKWAKCRQVAGQSYSVPLPALASSPACPVTLLIELAA